MLPEALPPHRPISSAPISTSAASHLLGTYIANSELHPHLHPDALITPGEVSFSSHGGSSGGVVMHNLRRVAAGLRGEYLEPEPTPEPEGAEQQDAENAQKEGGNMASQGHKGEGKEPGWQDMSEYEREEGGIEVGELGERNNIVTVGGDAPAVEPTSAIEGHGEVGSKRKAKEDKEARKKAKKERNKEFKKQKEKGRGTAGMHEE